MASQTDVGKRAEGGKKVPVLWGLAEVIYLLPS